MSRHLLLVCSLVVAGVTVALDDEEAFTAWRNRYQKQYDSDLELEIAKKNFARSEEFIKGTKSQWEM